MRNNGYQCISVVVNTDFCLNWTIIHVFEAFNEPNSEQHPLPLGIEFQDLVDTFVHPKRKENKYEKTGRLIEQLQ